MRTCTRWPRGRIGQAAEAGNTAGRRCSGILMRSLWMALAVTLLQLAVPSPAGAAARLFFEEQRGPWSVQGLDNDGYRLCLVAASYGAFKVGVFAGRLGDGTEDYGVIFAGLEADAGTAQGVLRFSSGRIFVGQLRRSAPDHTISVRLGGTHDDPKEFFRSWAEGRHFELVLAGEVIGPLQLNGTRNAMGALVECAARARAVPAPSATRPAEAAPSPQPEARMPATDLPEAEARVSLDGGWVDYAGPITAGAVERAVALLPLATHGLLISSPGGDLAAAIRLAAAVRDLGLDTAAYELCASACVTALAGGIERWVGTGTLIGVHQFEWVSVQRDARDTQATVGLLGRFYKTMGVDSELVVLASETPPESMRWLSRKELSSLRLATGFYEGDG